MGGTKIGLFCFCFLFFVFCLIYFCDGILIFFVLISRPVILDIIGQ